MAYQVEEVDVDVRLRVRTNAPLSSDDLAEIIGEAIQARYPNPGEAFAVAAVEIDGETLWQNGEIA